MFAKFGWMIVAVLVLAVAPGSRAAEKAALDLGDGYTFELLGAGDTQARVGSPKVIFVKVALGGAKAASEKKDVLEASDRMFESVLMDAAEKGYYKRATVQMRKADGAGFDEFLYTRRDDGVWLRQAGKEPWMKAQDPAAWTPPKTEKISVQGFGPFFLEASLEIPAPAGFHRAAEIDFVTATSLVDLQRKYQETKALWARIDREQMRKDGFDLVMIGNFATPQRGRFHARKGFFVRIPREANGPWPELPASTPENRDLLLSKNEVQIEELATRIAKNFESGMTGHAPAEDSGAIALVSDTPSPVKAEVGFSRVVPSVRARAIDGVITIR